ncbi:DUF222 domain-containing protein [Microbispora sp. RL4-1S]|uniref:DUF222 domain-containing protein n=1 Tax=Microbispora oryzae TaxID=2806554 RepID=A0A940WHC4_9ACTN|nr:HNH endonuclease signature motif containing protein [Microbispora oryzae]MBP2705590.1 DUF222 domain-containing protein [Microbispora oryzae]
MAAHLASPLPSDHGGLPRASGDESSTIHTGPALDEPGDRGPHGGWLWDSVDRGPVPIPEGIAVMPPGPELARILADVNVATVSGYDTVEVVRAAYRQCCHDRARFLYALLEAGLREPFSGAAVRRLGVPDEFAPDEARAALVWSRRRADSTFELAWNVHRRLPVLGEAMLAGDLDEPRAAAFIRWTAGLTDEQAVLICEQLVGQAAAWTVGELIDHIQRRALAIDPDWARRRYAEAVRRRRVVGVRNDDGTASVSGQDLPIDRAAAGCDRIDEMARSCKRSGDRRPIDHIRADLFLGSLDGTFEGLSDEQIVAWVLTHPFIEPPLPGDDAPGDPGTATVAEPPAEPAPARVLAPAHVGPGRQPRAAGDAGQNAGEDTRPDSCEDTLPDSCEDTLPDSCEGTLPDRCEDTRSDSCGEAHSSSSAGGHKDRRDTNAGPVSDVTVTGRAWPVRELRVEVTSLLGRDEHPAELPGWGFIHAPLARQILTQMTGAEWRFAVCDEDGRLLHAGITRRRPADGGKVSRRSTETVRRPAVVELQISLATLRELAADPDTTGPWATVVADLARQVAGGVTGPPGRPERSIVGSPGNGAGPRRAGAILRRYVQIRGRVCSWPGCRVPATNTDQDHAVDWLAKGRTEERNLDLVCRHDHRAKHQGGWRVALPESGVVVWTSPLGHVYPVPLPPIMAKLLAPAPRNWPNTLAMPYRGEAEQKPLMRVDGGRRPPDPAPGGGREASRDLQSNHGAAGAGAGACAHAGACGDGACGDGAGDDRSEGAGGFPRLDAPPF